MLVKADADAFIRNILSHPADTIGRLAFSDWLEETEDPSNVEWADHLRTTADLTPRALTTHLRTLKDHIKARIRLNGTYFSKHAVDLMRLLPPRRLELSLDGLYVPQGVLERCPVDLARTLDVLPILEIPGKCLVFAAVHAKDEATRATLEKETGWTVLFVSATAEDIHAAQLHLYGPPHSMEDTVQEAAVPLTATAPALKSDPYDGFPVERLVFLLLRDGVRWQATELLLEARATNVIGEYTQSCGKRYTEPFPARMGLPILSHLQELLHLPGGHFPLCGHMTFRYGGGVYPLQVQIGMHEDDFYYALITFPAH